jgi:methyl-accepting chemotaxis protein
MGRSTRAISAGFLAILVGGAPMASAQTVRPSRPATSGATTSTEKTLAELETDRPDITEGSGVVGAGLWQVETGVLFQSDRVDPVTSRDLSVPNVLLRVGVSSRLELRVGGEGFLSESLSTPGTGMATGGSDVELSLKYKFLDQEHGGIDFAVIPLVSLPTGSDDFTTGGYDPTIKFALGRSLPRGFGIGGNVIVSSVTEDSRRFTQTSVSASVSHALGENWGGFWELYGASKLSRDGGRAWLFDTGITHTFGDNLQIDLSVGRGLSAGLVHRRRLRHSGLLHTIRRRTAHADRGAGLMKRLLWLNVGGLAVTLMLVLLQLETSASGRDALSRAMKLTQVAGRAEAIQTNMMQMSDAMRGYLLDTTRQDEWDRKIKADEELSATVAEVKKIADDPQLIDLVTKIGQIDDERLNPAENKVLTLAKTDREAAVKSYFADYLPVRQEELALVAALRSTSDQLSRDFAQREIAAMSARRSFALWACGGLVLLVAIGVAWSATTTWTLQRRIAEAAASLGAGAGEVLAGARQVAQGAQALSMSSSGQAASLEETSASMTEVTSMIEQNAQHTGNATELMREVERRVTDATEALASMMASMGEIKDSSGQISRIMRTVDEIAFQTNILALNAAVEAARAGEAGLGFAVVADEVRNLALRSAECSRDTSGLIEQSVSKTQQGSTKLDAVAAAIQAIEERVASTKSLIEQVSAASREQALSVSQISETVQHMEVITQESAAIAQQNAAASEEMSAQAETAQDLAATLQMLIGAQSAARKASTDDAGTDVRHTGTGRAGGGAATASWHGRRVA